MQTFWLIGATRTWSSDPSKVDRIIKSLETFFKKSICKKGGV